MVCVIKLLIIGMGGIEIVVDVFEFMMVGVSVVVVGVVYFKDIVVCFYIVV